MAVHLEHIELCILETLWIFGRYATAFLPKPHRQNTGGRERMSDQYANPVSIKTIRCSPI
jgi:hypothetical protein